MRDDNDNFFDLFKQSSETERSYDVKPSSWNKVNARLAIDRNAKWKRILRSLPWVVLPFLFLLNGMLFIDQKEANQEITKLKKQLEEKQTEQIVDTVVQMKQTTQFIYDTVYIHHIPKHQYLSANQQFGDGMDNNSYGTSKNDKKSSDNTVSENRNSNIKPVDEKITIQNKTNPKNDDNTTEYKDEMVVSQGSINSIKKDDESLGLYTSSVSDKNNSNENKSPNHPSESTRIVDDLEKNVTSVSEDLKGDQIMVVETKNDSIAPSDNLASNNSNKAVSEQQERKTFKDRLAKTYIEYGPEVGGLFPDKVDDVRQYGLNLGLGANWVLTKNFQIWSNLKYQYLFMRAKGADELVAWIPSRTLEDPTFTLDESNVSIPSLSYTFGLRYLLPLRSAVRPLFDLGYGAHYVFPASIMYKFENDLPNQELEVEKRLDRKRFVFNDLQLGVGFQYSVNGKMNAYLLSHYRFNRGNEIYRNPDYLGISLGLFW